MFSSTDIVLLSRIAAHVFPDVMRNVCKNQSEDTRRKLEGALNSAGLINIRESDICNDSECQRMSGDDNVKRDQKTIKSIIEISRSMLISAYSQESSEVLARYCNQTIKKIENVKSNKPEKMIEELALN